MKKLFLVLFLAEIFALNGSGKQEQTIPVETIPVEEITITLGAMTLTTDSANAAVSGVFIPNSPSEQTACRRIVHAKRTIRKPAGKK